MSAEAGLILALVGAYYERSTGKAQQKSAYLNAYNIETQKKISDAEAKQRSNDRMEQYRSNLSANIASFAAMGRDIGGADRSVGAFLDRQKQIATDDVARSDFMGMAQGMKLQQQATATRIEGRARKVAADIGAFTTVVNAINSYSQTKGSGST